VILCLDTSGRELLVCVLDDELRLGPAATMPGSRHQDGIIAAVNEVLGGPDAVRKLRAIAVVRGPGSQTGLRVGLAAAEGLAFAPRLPLLPLSSLAVAAHRGATGGMVIGVVSAGRSNVYGQAFVAHAESRVEQGSRVLGPASQVRALLGVDAGALAAGEAAVLEQVGEPVSRPLHTGAEALAAAAREVAGKGLEVAYHRVTGDYGE
jgi:tRNA threonylcarbamoyladenosine biosynthesis protein TsaB